MIDQLWGPVFNLVGEGGYRALTFGDWFVMKYSNVVMFVVAAAVFVIGAFVNLPGSEVEQ